MKTATAGYREMGMRSWLAEAEAGMKPTQMSDRPNTQQAKTGDEPLHVLQC
jgi:hypothetical protein